MESYCIYPVFLELTTSSLRFLENLTGKKKKKRKRSPYSLESSSSGKKTSPACSVESSVILVGDQNMETLGDTVWYY